MEPQFMEEYDEENDSDYVPSTSGRSSSESDISMTPSGAFTMSTSSNGTSPQSFSAPDSIAPGDSASHTERKPQRTVRRGDTMTSESSDRSMTSTSEDAEEVFPYDDLFKSLFGRRFNKSGHYMLPADGDEHSRHDIQHAVLHLHLGELYDFPDLVKHALRPGQSPPPAVLDVGTGSGKWAIDMALEFPHVEVKGMDLTPPTVSADFIPDNCTFEVDDANADFSHCESAYNLVHVRSIDVGMNDFHTFTYQIARTLRPDGILFLIFGSLQMYDENLQPLPTPNPGEPRFTWCQRVLGAAYNAYVNRGNRGIHASMMWTGWLEKNPNYRNIVTHDTFVPVGEWKHDMSDREKGAARLMKESVHSILLAFKPLLLTDGHDEEEVDEWIKSAHQELRDLNIKAHIKWQYTTAIRTDTPWQDRELDEEPEAVEEIERMIPPPPTRKSRSPAAISNSS